MHANMKNVKDFLESSYRNAWLNRDGQAVYVRKSVRVLGDQRYERVFDIANIETPEKKQGRGRFKQFLSEVETALEGTTYQAIYIENVLTVRFADYFRRTGWKETFSLKYETDFSQSPCFYKLLKG
jgi:hypothetical protein